MKIQSLALKITLVLLLVSLLGISFVAVYASQITTQEFSKFLFRQDQEQVVENLVALYEGNGNWENISARDLRFLPGGMLRTYAVVDVEGVVVIPSVQHAKGTQLSRDELALGVDIEVDGQVVGRVLPGMSRGNMVTPMIESFSGAINQSLLVGGLIAVGVSLLAGLVFSWTLTRRLKKLVTVAQAISKGELNQQVDIKSGDEIGELAAAFNQMSMNLERSQQLRRQMTADIAHELRTPLSIIVGRAETLADGMLPPTQETFQVIHDEARHINRLVEDLRTLSLSDAGELSLEKREVVVKDLLDDFMAAYVANAERKDIALISNYPDALPSIQADPDRLKQVLANLMSNAIRYTPEGGRITLSAAQSDQGITISVKDNGSGVPQEEIPFLFERFYRGDKAREREKGGSGLGLAIVKTLVQAHNGQITVQSDSGRGTVFNIWLPIA